MPSTPLKGLTQYIADLRNVSSREEEEARINVELSNIRQKFHAPNLSAYNRVKYVSKLIYTHILGYQVDLGHNEALELMGSPKYREKSVGYLALQLIWSENQEVVHSCMPVVQADLASLSDADTALALNFLACVPVGDTTAEAVYKVLISPTSAASARKKAALVLLRMVRIYNISIFPEWMERIVALVETPDIGVAHSATELVLHLTLLSEHVKRLAYPCAVRRLHALHKGKLPPDYTYQGVSAPWFTVKLLELILASSPSKNSPGVAGYVADDASENTVFATLKTLTEATANIIVRHKKVLPAQAQNAHGAVFFATANLVISHYTDTQLLGPVCECLVAFLGVKDTNYRYLSLKALVAVSFVPDRNKTINEVVGLLKDRDVSVRRAALQALLSLTTSDTVQQVAAELLDYLAFCDSAVRQDTVSVIAVLIEKYATNHKWYVDTSFSLLMLAGSSVSEEVWQRLVQVVINNEQIQVYTCKTGFEYLKQSTCSESMLKVMAYLLGEIGNQVSALPGLSPLNQFIELQNKSNLSSSCRYFLIGAYIKFAYLYRDLRPQIQTVMEQYARSSDFELQQRACEYLRMLEPENEDLLGILWQEMPPFPVRQSALVSRISRRPTLRKNVTGMRSTHSTHHSAGTPSLASPTHDLASLNLQNLSSNWEHGFRKLLTCNSGILYQDALLQVGCKYEFRQRLGCVILYLKNISTIPLTSISIAINNPMDDDVLSMSVKNHANPNLAPGALTEQVIVCEAKQPFALSPLTKISYVAGNFFEMTLKLPIVVERFMEPVVLQPEEFARRWRDLGPDTEFVRTFKNSSGSLMRALVFNDAETLKEMNYGLVPQTTALKSAAGILHTSVGGSFGCLIVLEPLDGREKIKVTTRATNKIISVVLAKNISNVYQL